MRIRDALNTVADCHIFTSSGCGILVDASGCQIHDNYIYDSTVQGIRLNSGADNNIIRGNVIDTAADGIRLVDDNDYNVIAYNWITTCSGVGMIIATANADENYVFDNYLFGETFTDNGTNTRLPTLELAFVYGNIHRTADGEVRGWDIDADTEYACAYGFLPIALQQIVRIKIYAIAMAAPGAGNYMHLELRMQGAASDETYTTEDIIVANKDTEEVNFAISDVIHWVFTSTDDADIGHLEGGDYMQIKVKHEAAGVGDIATDARFGIVVIEYV